MAKFVYTSAKVLFAEGGLDWTSDDIRCFPTKAYTASAGHDFLDDIVAGKRAATAVAITTPTDVGGLCTCDTVTFPTVTTAQTIDGFVFYLHTGVEATSSLIAYIGEDSGGTIFAIATNGSNITFTPNAAGVLSFA